MGRKWGTTDFSQLKALQKRIEKMEKAEFAKFCEECAKELAARLLAKVIQRTQPGQYPPSSGKKGGTLRRGWTSKTHEEAANGSGNGKNAKDYAKSLQIKRIGNVYEIEVVNPVKYAIYYEYGHRTKGHKGWVLGKFVLKDSEIELDGQAQQIVEKKLLKFMKECLDD